MADTMNHGIRGHYGVGWSSWRRDKGKGERVVALTVTRTPWRWYLINLALRGFDAATQHRFCSSLWSVPLAAAVIRHQDDFRVELPAEEVLRFNRWRGWDDPFWSKDEDL